MSKIKILHIEDDEDFSFILKRILENYDIVNVTTDKEALNKLKNQNDFNIIICDCRLPDICGIELVKEIRNFTNMPIIANSSLVENNIEMLRSGANIYVTKDYFNMKDKLKLIIEDFVKDLNL